jgi:hypothetical protein
MKFFSREWVCAAGAAAAGAAGALASDADIADATQGSSAMQQKLFVRELLLLRVGGDQVREKRAYA